MSNYRQESLWDDRIPTVANEKKSQLVNALVHPEIRETLPAKIGRSPGLKEEIRRYQEAEKYLYPRDIVRHPDKELVLQQDHSPPILMPRATLSIMEGILAGRQLKVLETKEYGEGGYGKVLGAELPDGSEAVVKRWQKSKKSSGTIIRECAANLACAQDPNLGINQVLAITREGIVLEKLKGYDLAGWAEECTNDVLVCMLKTLAESLQGLHERGYVFGDLKLENVFLHWECADEKDCAEPWLVDCGGMGEIGRARGCVTPGYIPPESRKAPGECGKVVFNQKTDVYAFGIILLRLLKNNHLLIERNAPFVGDSEEFWRFVQKEVEMGVALGAEDTKILYRLVGQCTSKDPNSRPSFEQIRAQLDRVYNGSSPLTESHCFISTV